MLKKVTDAARLHRRKLPPIYSPIFDGSTGWYEGWYFILRLEEEASRALRHRLSVTVVSIYLDCTLRTKSEELQRPLSTIARSKLRRSDLPAILGNHELAVCLTHTSATQARAVVARIQAAFEPLRASIGVATLPDDARDSVNLLLIAQHRARAALGDRVSA